MATRSLRLHLGNKISCQQNLRTSVNWKLQGEKVQESGGNSREHSGSHRHPPSRPWIFWSELVHITGLNAVQVNSLINLDHYTYSSTAATTSVTNTSAFVQVHSGAGNWLYLATNNTQCASNVDQSATCIWWSCRTAYSITGISS